MWPAAAAQQASVSLTTCRRVWIPLGILLDALRHELAQGEVRVLVLNHNNVVVTKEVVSVHLTLDHGVHVDVVGELYT